MPRGSFSRTVARAAASGGSRSYRARRPYAWYLLLAAIVVAGISLVVVSRNDRIHTKTAAAKTESPGKSANWNVALAFDICGTIQPNLAPSTNLSTVGIRTFGNGLINITPAVASKPAEYEGVNAALSTFIENYAGLNISETTLRLGKDAKLWTNGDACTGPLTGKGEVQFKVWSSPKAKPKLVSPNPTLVHLNNDEMITVAFVPKGASIPAPPSKSELASA